MLTINLEFDANALAAPQSFRDAVQATANVLDAAIDDPITVNVGVGYGEYDNGSQVLNQGDSLGGVSGSVPVSYALLRAALMASESSATDTEAYAALPAATSLNGQTTFYVSRAEAKALGALPATGGSIDGYAGFPTSFTPAQVSATAFAELTHALGLLNAGFPLSLVEYTGAGTHLLTNGGAGTPAYFSLDGGTTSLASYDVGFDSTLFSSPGNDPLSVPSTGASTLSSLDLQELDAIGYDVTSTRAPPAPTIMPATLAAGAKPTLAAQNATVAANAAIPVAALIKSVGVAAGDSISSYSFNDTGGGHFVIDGIIEPAGTTVSALDTQLDSLDFVGGPTAGTDTVSISARDDTTAISTFASSTVTTTSAKVAFTSVSGTVTTTTNPDGSVSITTVPGMASVQLGAAATAVASTGTDTILASSGTAAIVTSGNATVVGGTGALTVHGGPGNDLVFAGPGGLSFVGGGGFDIVVGGGYPDTITGGTGGGLFQGGGNSTITAGAGGAQNIEFGSNGDQMFAAGPSGVLFGDGGGGSSAATLMSSAADTGNSVFFGAGGSGAMTFITGAGNDLVAVGKGTNTVRLGSGTDTVFANSPAAGSTTITVGTGNANVVMGGAMTDLVVAAGNARAFTIYNDAASTDHVSLANYGANQVASAIANQTHTAGGSILSLNDGTTLAFVGIQTATASLFG